MSGLCALSDISMVTISCQHPDRFLSPALTDYCRHTYCHLNRKLGEAPLAKNRLTVQQMVVNGGRWWILVHKRWISLGFER